MSKSTKFPAGYTRDSFEPMKYPIMIKDWEKIDEIKGLGFFEEPEDWPIYMVGESEEEFNMTWQQACQYITLLYDPGSPMIDIPDRSQAKKMSAKVLGLVSDDFPYEFYRDHRVKKMATGFLANIGDLDFLWLMSAKEWFNHAMETTRTPIIGLADDKEATAEKNKISILMEAVKVKEQIKEHEGVMARLRGEPDEDLDTLMDPMYFS